MYFIRFVPFETIHYDDDILYNVFLTRTVYFKSTSGRGKRNIMQLLSPLLHLSLATEQLMVTIIFVQSQLLIYEMFKHL